MARANRVMAQEVETVFLPSGEVYSHVSSTLIRQVATVASRNQLEQFVPDPVIDPLLAKVAETASGRG